MIGHNNVGASHGVQPPVEFGHLRWEVGAVGSDGEPREVPTSVSARFGPFRSSGRGFEAVFGLPKARRRWGNVARVT